MCNCVTELKKTFCFRIWKHSMKSFYETLSPPIRHCLDDSSCIHRRSFPTSPERSAGHYKLPLHHRWPVHCQRCRRCFQLLEPRWLEVHICSASFPASIFSRLLCLSYLFVFPWGETNRWSFWVNRFKCLIVKVLTECFVLKVLSKPTHQEQHFRGAVCVSFTDTHSHNINWKG